MTEEATANAKVLLLGAGGASDFLEKISGDGVFDAHGSRVGRWTFAVRGHSLGLGFALPSHSDSAVRWAAREARLAVVIPGVDAFEWIRAALLQPEVAALPKLFLFPNDIPRDVCMQELGILDKDSEEFLENVCWDVRSLLNQLGKRVLGASREELLPKPWPFPSV